MSDLQEQPDLVLHKMIALFAIAFELKYGTIDKRLAQMAAQGDLASGEHVEDEIKEIEQQIRQLKEQIDRIEETSWMIEELMPKLLAAVGRDSNAICTDSDPRKTQFFRVWDDPNIVIDDWLHLSQSLSEKEKESFADQMMSMAEKFDLSQLGFSDLYPNSTL